MEINKKTIVAAALLLCLIPSQIGTAELSAADCYDGCYTGCVQSNLRLMERCNRKCQIKCDPAGSRVLQKNLT